MKNIVWPFDTWKQGYILGLINGFMFGAVIAYILFFIIGR